MYCEIASAYTNIENEQTCSSLKKSVFYFSYCHIVFLFLKSICDTVTNWEKKSFRQEAWKPEWRKKKRKKSNYEILWSRAFKLNLTCINWNTWIFRVFLRIVRPVSCHRLCMLFVHYRIFLWLWREYNTSDINRLSNGKSLNLHTNTHSWMN